jgi:hypothetical protein
MTTAGIGLSEIKPIKATSPDWFAKVPSREAGNPGTAQLPAGPTRRSCSVRCAENGLFCRIPAPHLGQQHKTERGPIKHIASPGQTVFGEVVKLAHAATGRIVDDVESGRTRQEADARYSKEYRERKRAGVAAPAVDVKPGPDAEPKARAERNVLNGVDHGITSYRNGCRCDVCRASNAKAQRDYQERRAAKCAAPAEASAP